MRDRRRVEARPVAHERDPKGVDPRPGSGSLWVCSVTTTEPGPFPYRMRGLGLEGWLGIVGDVEERGECG